MVVVERGADLEAVASAEELVVAMVVVMVVVAVVA